MTETMKPGSALDAARVLTGEFVTLNPSTISVDDAVKYLRLAPESEGQYEVVDDLDKATLEEEYSHRKDSAPVDRMLVVKRPGDGKEERWGAHLFSAPAVE